MNIQMTYSENRRLSPYGFCWSPALEKSIERFGKLVYKVTLGLDDLDKDDGFFKDIEDFKKKFEDSIGIPITKNNLLYRSVAGNLYATFYQSDKGQTPPLCYLDGGHHTHPPIDGDRIRVIYTIGGWFNPDEKKAGMKLYLDAVEVAIRSGTPRPVPSLEDEDDSW